MAAALIAHQTWAWFALGYLGVRLVTWRCRRGQVLVLLAALLMAGRCHLQNQRVAALTAKQDQAGTYLVRVQPDQWKVDGNLAKATGTSRGQTVSLSLYLTSAGQARQLKTIHQPVEVRVRGKWGPFLPATNFNQFDYRFYQQQRGIYNQVRGEGSIQPQAPAGWRDRLHCWRARLKQRFARFPQPLAGYCQQLLLGESEPELAKTLAAAKVVGVIHLFCLSGLHAFVFVGLLKRGLVALNLSKEAANWWAMALLPLLWFFGGAATSLTRATMMLEFQLAAQQLGLPRRVGWSLSLLVHSFLVPGVLLSLGGQLSYLLALALSHQRLKRPFDLLLATQLVGLPPLLVSVYKVHLVSLLANWLLVPLFAGLVLPAVILAAVVGGACPAYLSLVNLGLTLLQDCLGWLAAWPGAIYFGKLAAPVAVGLTLLTLLMLDSPAAFRRGLPLLAGLYLACFLVIHFPPSGEVTFVDIGQGDCAIIRTPFNRQVIMIDTGGQLAFRQPAWAKRQASQTDRATSTSINYLKSKGIHRVDYLCLSHRDADHIGFTRTVMANLTVKQVLVPAGMEKQARFTRQLPRRVSVRPLLAGQRVAGLPLTVVHPFAAGEGTNEDSLVLAGTFGGATFLFTGDLDRAGERAIAKRYPALRPTVVKLGHHGSKTATDPTVLRRWAPRLAIISAGRQNRYGHPNRETIATLKRQRVPYLSTQGRGMIRYRYWGNRSHLETKLKGSELAWMLPPYESN